MAVDQAYGFGEIVYPYAGQHRAKDFLAVDAHLGGDVVEQRGAQPEAVFKAGFSGYEVATIDQQLSTGFHALIDVARDSLQRRTADNRPHLRLQVAAVGDA
ncbi:hypothetical protein D3C80_1704480 [compost metagenome]